MTQPTRITLALSLAAAVLSAAILTPTTPAEACGYGMDAKWYVEDSIAKRFGAVLEGRQNPEGRPVLKTSTSEFLEESRIALVEIETLQHTRAYLVTLKPKDAGNAMLRRFSIVKVERATAGTIRLFEILKGKS